MSEGVERGGREIGREGRFGQLAATLIRELTDNL